MTDKNELNCPDNNGKYRSNTEIQHLNSDYLKYYSKLDFKEVGKLFPTRENDY